VNDEVFTQRRKGAKAQRKERQGTHESSLIYFGVFLEWGDEGAARFVQGMLVSALLAMKGF